MRDGNAEAAVCWFCNARPSAEALTVDMYVPLRKRSGRGRATAIEFNVDTIAVPRCGRCKSAHTGAKWVASAVTALGSLAGLAAFVAMNSRSGYVGRMGAVAVVAGAVLGFTGGQGLARAIMPSGVRAEAAKAEHPLVQRRLSSGWRIGRRPGTRVTSDAASVRVQARQTKRQKRRRRKERSAGHGPGAEEHPGEPASASDPRDR